VINEELLIIMSSSVTH